MKTYMGCFLIHFFNNQVLYRYIMELFVFVPKHLFAWTPAIRRKFRKNASLTCWDRTSFW